MELAAVLGVVVVAGLIYDTFLSKKARNRRHLTGAEVRRIPRFPSGQRGRIRGKVVPIKTSTAPLSGRECLYYHVTATAYVPDLSGHRSIKTLIDERYGHDFIVDDNHGRARIDLSHLEAEIEMDSLGEFTPKERNADMELLVARNLNGRHRQYALRFYEGIISPGEYVSILGYGDWQSGDGTATRGSTQTLVMGGTSEEPLVLTDVASEVWKEG